MIRKVWLQQPIAFARVGPSRTPLSAFRWTQPDLRPRGTGRTTITPAATFDVDATTGVPTRRGEEEEFTLFRDEDGIRPVAPFFELHGDWDGRAEQSTALTTRVLEENGLSLSSLTWDIHHANHKAYSLTRAEGDRVEARATIRGDDHARQDLKGISPEGAPNPLVPRPGIDMGAIQVVRPTADHPEIRIRFYPPPGHAYGPTDLQERLKKKRWGPLDLLIALLRLNADWEDFQLPKCRCILNPNSGWPNYKLLTWGQVLRALPRVIMHPRSFIALCRHVQRSELLRFLIGPTADAGKLPPGLYASWTGGGAVLSSLGLIDDLGDGVITCRLDGVGAARARIVVAPPHFSPDRRPPVSIADDLTDRTKRADVRAEDWVSEKKWPEAEAEIDDLLDRAFETAALSNLDAWNDELRSENTSDAVYRGDKNPPPNAGDLLWPDRRNETVLDLPLTEHGRWQHRRNSADEYFEQLFRDDDKLVEQWIRDPRDVQPHDPSPAPDDRRAARDSQGLDYDQRIPGPLRRAERRPAYDPTGLYYDRRMPALMRGADRRPLHLTRRQFGAFRRWAERLRARKQEEEKQ